MACGTNLNTSPNAPLPNSDLSATADRGSSPDVILAVCSQCLHVQRVCRVGFSLCCSPSNVQNRTEQISTNFLLESRLSEPTYREGASLFCLKVVVKVARRSPGAVGVHRCRVVAVCHASNCHLLGFWDV